MGVSLSPLQSSPHDADPEVALRRLLDDARAADDAGERTRRRWLRQQVEEEARAAGVLSTLSERGARVLLTLTTGRRHEGRIVGLGRDVCALETAKGGRVWVRLDAIAVVRPEGALEHAPAGDARARSDDLDFAQVLARLAEDRPTVQLGFRDDLAALTGELRSVGADVATLWEGQRRTPCYVMLPSVTEVSLFGSG